MALQKQNSKESPFLLAKEFTETGKQLNATRVDFLKIDVETALTFSGLALGAKNEEKKLGIEKMQGRRTTLLSNCRAT